VRRLFAMYALVSLVPVLLLGAALLALLQRQGEQHGVAEARARAGLLARTSIAPLVGGSDLRHGIGPEMTAALQRAVGLAIADHEVLRLRLRDLDARIIYADDGSGDRSGIAPDDEAVDAAHGETIAILTRLNSDAEDAGPAGPRVVEVYLPLRATTSGQPIGVLETYVPYAPIAADISQGQRAISLALTGGLVLLWLSMLAVSVSVTRRLRRQSVANAFLARHDPLTGMPNRAHFSERATRAISASGSDRITAVALIDLDRFKEVNDTLGHGVGDQLLMVLAQRLNLHVRDGDTLARLGGDEFGVVLCGLTDASEAVVRLSQLRAAVSEPVQINGVPLAVEASAGFALAPTDGNDIGTLLQRAEVAMYVAKREHIGIAHYRSEQDQYDSATLTLVAQLGAAIADDQLVLHYQPKGTLADGRVVAVEALVRWQHPTRGLLYPDAFLPAAEQTELIEDLTHWVLRRATSVLALDPSGRLAVAVNASARSLARSDFATDLLDILAETQTDPRRVILEITETALMVDPVRAVHTLGRLSGSGVRIAIDDFGAGHTSLGYLATLPISELKIDKAFVLAMIGDERNTAIVRSVIELGHSLGFTVTAEGVETPEALRRLTELGCDTVQGYLLARPAPAADLPRRIADAAAVLAERQAATVSLHD
jgi:diguanylate cyclase (GGDEF)-like protein